MALGPDGRKRMVLQSFETGSPYVPEWIVLDYERRTQIVSKGGKYFTTKPVLTTNGRLFFPCSMTNVAVYKPDTERVVQLGQLVNPIGAHSSFYRMAVGHSGKVYAGTQCATGLPVVVEINPDTLVSRTLGSVGRLPRTVPLSYCYWIAEDLPWLYAVVGENPWQLAALNLDTGEQRILDTRPGAGSMAFTCRDRGISVALKSSPSTSETKWLADGQLFPYTGANQNPLPFTARDTRPLVGEIPDPPSLGEVTWPSSDRQGKVRWLPVGDTWHETSFEVEYVSPIALESLISLPDGALYGNAQQYHGFFRRNPTGVIETYNSSHPSQPVFAIAGTKIYVSGYPNAGLYVSDGRGNPNLIGYFSASRCHYPLQLVAAKSKRLYMAGRLERDGTGAGVGYYDPSGSWGGHNTNLASLLPSGLVVLERSKQVVMATKRLTADGLTAPLIVYDFLLNEIKRQTVLPGLASCGQVFTMAASTSSLIGICDTPASKGPTNTSSIYLWDVAANLLRKWVVLSGRIEAVTRKSDGVLVAVLGTGLVEIDLVTFAVTIIKAIDVDPAKIHHLALSGGETYFAYKTELRRA